jgi:hypothetical protein
MKTALIYLLFAAMCYGQTTVADIQYEGRDYKTQPYTAEEKVVVLTAEKEKLETKYAAVIKDPQAEITRITTYLSEQIAIKGRGEKIIKVQTELLQKIKDSPSWWLNNRTKNLLLWQKNVTDELNKLKEVSK